MLLPTVGRLSVSTSCFKQVSPTSEYAVGLEFNVLQCEDNSVSISFLKTLQPHCTIVYSNLNNVT